MDNTKQAKAAILYRAENIDELEDSHDIPTGYLKALMKNAISFYIDNISAEMNLLRIGDALFPLLITHDNEADSYVCSPYGHYISLASESLNCIRNKFLRTITFSAFETFSSLIKRGQINRCVYINHSLFSTDLHPDSLSKAHLDSVILFLKNKFPNHALIFRSINSKTCPNLQRNLKSCGFNFIASRQIYLTELNQPNLFQARIIKSDLKLWKESDYEIVDQKDFTHKDEQRILELYTGLAIDHHSKLNPKLNINFLKLIDKHSLFNLKALKKAGRIEGVVGYQIKEKTLLCSIFGYDLEANNKSQIYRLLSTFLLLEASRQAEVFHQSAGASFFKTIRRAKGILEYQAIYTKHLTFRQKFAWGVLKNIVNGFGIPFMKKY